MIKGGILKSQSSSRGGIAAVAIQSFIDLACGFWIATPPAEARNDDFLTICDKTRGD
jgi:hypothetical protein